MSSREDAKDLPGQPDRPIPVMVAWAMRPRTGVCGSFDGRVHLPRTAVGLVTWVLFVEGILLENAPGLARFAPSALGQSLSGLRPDTLLAPALGALPPGRLCGDRRGRRHPDEHPSRFRVNTGVAAAHRNSPVVLGESPHPGWVGS